MNKKYSIFINEGETVFGIGLRVLLNTQPDLYVINNTHETGMFSTTISEKGPDLIVGDLYDHGDINIEGIIEIKQSNPSIKFLMVTQNWSEKAIRNALCAGVSGYVLRDASNAELLTAIRSVLEGKVYLSPSLSDNIINAFLLSGKQLNNKPRLEILTKREREILKMVAEGHTNRSVASRLCLSIKTVEKHRSNMMKKLDLHNASALTTFAIGQGLIASQE